MIIKCVHKDYTYIEQLTHVEVPLPIFNYHISISVILFHSGSKHDDLVRLNRLGVCMSPKQMVRAQAEMGKQLEGKVNVWKAQIEEQKGDSTKTLNQIDSTETTIKKGG